MIVKVTFAAQLRTAIGRSEEELELPPGSKLATLFEYLASRYDDAAPHLLAAGGQPHRSLLIVVNDSAVPAHAAWELPLCPGDVVALLPPIAGG